MKKNNKKQKEIETLKYGETELTNNFILIGGVLPVGYKTCTGDILSEKDNPNLKGFVGNIGMSLKPYDKIMFLSEKMFDVSTYIPKDEKDKKGFAKENMETMGIFCIPVEAIVCVLEKDKIRHSSNFLLVTTFPSGVMQYASDFSLGLVLKSEITSECLTYRHSSISNGDIVKYLEKDALYFDTTKEGNKEFINYLVPFTSVVSSTKVIGKTEVDTKVEIKIK